MWMEPGVLANPLTHFVLCVFRTLELSRPGVDVRQRNHGVRWQPPAFQQMLYLAPETLATRNAAVVRDRIETGHPTSEPRFQKAAQVRKKSTLGLPFD
jgi:hypothetical protein